jgi:hypothetical protein
VHLEERLRAGVQALARAEAQLRADVERGRGTRAQEMRRKVLELDQPLVIEPLRLWRLLMAARKE